MAAKKKTKPARKAKPMADHGGDSSDHGGGGVRISIEVGHIEWIGKSHGKKRRKAKPKEVKAFLEWALTQL